jgi:hypothetical protein
MGRLARVGALAPGPAAEEALAANLSLTMQLCAREERLAGARLVYAALAQNPARPAANQSVLAAFELNETVPGARTLHAAHPRRVRCASCDTQGPEGVVTREAGAPPAPLAPGVAPQLSVGEPVRLGAGSPGLDIVESSRGRWDIAQIVSHHWFDLCRLLRRLGINLLVTNIDFAGL